MDDDTKQPSDGGIENWCPGVDVCRGERMQPLRLMARRVAHDFNNLLQPVVGYVHLAHGEEDCEKAAPYLARAIAGAEAARDLVERISRIGQSDGQRATHVSLNGVVREVTEQFRKTAPAARIIELSLEVRALSVLAVPERLAELVSNLLTNALESLPDGGTVRVVTEKVTVSEGGAGNCSLPPGEYATIAVIDDGIGMDPETALRAFDPFFSTKAAGIGRGLGLTTVYDIATELKAEIFVTSTPGRGTSVRICVPMAHE